MSNFNDFEFIFVILYVSFISFLLGALCANLISPEKSLTINNVNSETNKTTSISYFEWSRRNGWQKIREEKK